MSDNRIKEETLNSEDALNMFKKNCRTFLEMNSQEKSEGIKINYLIGLIKLSDNLKIDEESFIKALFDEILFKDLTILKNRNLFANFIYELEKRKNQDLFQSKFYSLLQEFGKEYNSNSIFFHQYLIDISLSYIFSSSFECEEKKAYIEMIIENDIKPFETQLFKRIINKNEKLIDNNMNKRHMIKCLFNKFIDMNKYKSCLILFMKILENVNNICRNIPKDIIYELIKAINNKGFNHVIKKTKEINDFLIFNCLLLGNLDEKLFISEVDIEILDSYLVNLLNLLALKKDLNVDIFNKIFSYYVKNKYKNLTKVYFDVLYYLSTYSFTSVHYDFICNCINTPQSNLIYNKTIKNHLLSLNKKPLRYKEKQINNQKKEKFNVVNDIQEKNYDLIDYSLFSFNNNSNNLSFLNHLNLFGYIINACFNINISSDNVTNIEFYPKILNKILVLLNNLSLENANKKLFEELLMFLFNLFSVLFNLYFSERNLLFKEEYLLDSFLKIIEKSSNDNKYLIIFPSLMNTIKTLFNNEFSKDSTFNNDKIYNFIFDYMISKFSFNDNSASIINQQNILIFKSLIIMLVDKNNQTPKKKYYLMDKLIDLASKSNDDKILFSFYELCEELIKTSSEENINLGYYSLNKYSKVINNHYIKESFIEYISEKFKEAVMQKRPNNIEFDDNLYFLINTISNIYNKVCIKYKNIPNEKLNPFIDLIEEFCDPKYIIGVCDNLFISIEKNECDMINIIKSDKNIYSKYYEINNALDNLDYNIYSYNNNFDNNNKNNKISLCHFGILKSLAYLLSGYLSNAIYTLLNSNNDNKIEAKNKKEETIMNLFDYVQNKILLNETLKNTAYSVYFFNCVFNNKYVLHYFTVHYTNYSINNIAKDNQQEIVFYQEMFNKNNSIMDYVRQNQYFILFMKDIINSFFEFDTNFLIDNKNNNNLMKSNIQRKNLWETKNIVNELLRKEDKSLIKYNENQKSMINSFFTKIFLDEIFEKNNPHKKFENMQIIFLFLLDNSLLEKYFCLYGAFFNIDYILIQLYSILRTKNLSIKLNEKIIYFIAKYISLDNFGNYIIGMMSNTKIFNSFFKDKNINESYIYNLFNIMNNSIVKMLDYENNNNQKFINLLIKIIDYINNFYKTNPNLANLELYLLGKIINDTLNYIVKKSNTEENTRTPDEINKIDLIKKSIYSSVIPKYIKSVYYILDCIDNKNLNLDYEIDNAFFSFCIVLDILSKEDKIKEILSTQIESEILNFFNDFLCFNQIIQNPVDLKYYNLLCEKYLKYRNNSTKKKFIDYLYLFSLFKGKQDEKDLKSVVIEFFGEHPDERTKDNFKKYGFITCYFLSSIKKDATIGNKNNNNTIINQIDYAIIKSIGERFKDDEKSLQKNNLILSNKPSLI